MRERLAKSPKVEALQRDTLVRRQSVYGLTTLDVLHGGRGAEYLPRATALAVILFFHFDTSFPPLSQHTIQVLVDSLRTLEILLL